VQGLQLGPGGEAEVVAKAADEGPVDLPAATGLAALRQRLQVLAQRRFVERIGFEQAAGQLDRPLGVDAAGDPLQDGGAPGGAQPVALEAEPAGPGFARGIVEAGEQVAGVESRRRRCGLRAGPPRTRRRRWGSRGRAVCPSSSIGRPQATPCRRNSVLRRLAKASFWLCSGQKMAASSARPTQRASARGRPGAGCGARRAGRPARRRDRSSASRKVQAGGIGAKGSRRFSVGHRAGARRAQVPPHNPRRCLCPRDPMRSASPPRHPRPRLSIVRTTSRHAPGARSGAERLAGRARCRSAR
jgi:hypothetical protein